MESHDPQTLNPKQKRNKRAQSSTLRSKPDMFGVRAPVYIVYCLDQAWRSFGLPCASCESRSLEALPALTAARAAEAAAVRATVWPEGVQGAWVRKAFERSHEC